MIYVLPTEKKIQIHRNTEKVTSIKDSPCIVTNENRRKANSKGKM